MSSDLFERETAERLNSLEPVERIEPGAFTGFFRGAGMTSMRALARTGSAVDLLGALGPMAQDAISGGTEAQDRYFKEHDRVWGRAVDYWTPRPEEVGIAGQIAGELLTMLPMVIASPALAVGSLQLGEAEELVRRGAPARKALEVGTIQAAGLGLGIWVPILGRTLTQRVLVGGAGFNVVQGVATRGLSAEALKDQPELAEIYGALDPAYLTLDVLLGLAFGGLAHVSPAMRAQGAQAWDRLEKWLQAGPEGAREALATMRQAQHMAADSLPGRPAAPKDAQFHVERTRQAIEQMARNEPVDVSDIPEPRLEPLPPEIQAERQAHLEDIVAAAEEVRAAEGLPTPPEPEIAPPRPLVAEDMTLVPPEGQARVLGQAIENRLLELRMDEQQARANAAIWEAFFETTSRKYGVRVADLLGAYGIDVRRMSRADIERLQPEALTQPKAAEPKSYQRWIEGQEYEGRLFGGAYDNSRITGRMVARDAPMRKAILQARERYNEIRREFGLEEVQDWAKRPDQLVQKVEKPKQPSKERYKYNVGDEVVRVKDVGRGEDLGTMRGVVTKVTTFDKTQPGGVRSRVRVKWENGAEGTHDDRQVAHAPFTPMPGETLFQAAARSPLFQAKRAQQLWYSELSRQIEGANMKAAPAKGWKDYLKSLAQKGVKAEEIKWSGIEEWLDLQGGRVTKDAVVEFLKQRGVKVEEVVLGDTAEQRRASTEADQLLAELDNMGYDVQRSLDPNTEELVISGIRRRADGEQYDFDGAGFYISDPDGDIPARITAIGRRLGELDYELPYRDSIEPGAPKYSDPRYQLPGGKNYRELLLKLPEPDTENLPNGYKIAEVDQTQRLALEKNLEDLEAQWNAWLAQHDYPPLSADDFGAYARRAGYGEVPREHVQYAKNLERAWNDTQSMLTNESRYTLVGPDGTGQILRGAQTVEQATDQAMTLLDNQGVLDKGVFRESHWEQSNVLAHVRFNERTDAEGKKVLFIEEIQSDWAQKGKKRGFQRQPQPLPSELPEGARVERVDPERMLREDEAAYVAQDESDANVYRRELIDAGVKPEDILIAPSPRIHTDQNNVYVARYAVFGPDGNEIVFTGSRVSDSFTPERARKAALSELRRQVEAENKKSDIPAAPFVGKTEAWVGLVMKRMIREAAERGFDRIAWTTGEQQTARYTSALRKAVDEIHWKKTADGIHILGYKGSSSAASRQQVEARQLLRDRIADVDQRINTLMGDRSVADLNAGETTQLNELMTRRQALAAEHERMPRGEKVVDTTEKEDMLSDAIGKAMADRIINDPNQSGVISGEGIIVADTGMAAFYDRIVPNVAKQVLKDLGVPKAERVVGTTKIEITTVDTVDELPTFEMMTPEARDLYQGAEDFPNGGPPGFAETPVSIDGQEHRAHVIVDRQGVTMAVDTAPDGPLEFFVAWEDIGHPAGAGFASRVPNEGIEAMHLVHRAWKNPQSGLWENMTTRSGDPAVIRPVTGKKATVNQQSIAITPELRERALSGMPLFQGPERGAIRIGPETVIGLFEAADASTFLHESGHLFLSITRDMAASGRAPLQALSDWSALARWLGIEGGEITRAQQEKFATTFERYLAEGKAPSEELRSVFQQFRDWLIAIYRSIANIAQDIPDDIRGVLDRMLASERRDPTPKAEGPPRAEVEPPPPPGEAEAAGRPEAQKIGPDANWRELAGPEEPPAPRVRLPLTDPAVADKIDTMLAFELGWEQIGGRRADVSISTTSGQPNFTEWIPKSELWPGRPAKHMNEAAVRRAVEKARAGERLGKAEQATVDYLVDLANERLADVDAIGGPEEWNATARDVVDAGIEPSTENVVDTHLVARAAEVDDLALERAAQKYENDDAAFMAEVRRILAREKGKAPSEPGAKPAEGGQAGAGEAPGAEGTAQPDPLRDAALRLVEENPEQLITIGQDSDGNPVTKTLRQYLDDAINDAAQAREDIRLIEAAASCLYGRG